MAPASGNHPKSWFWAKARESNQGRDLDFVLIITRDKFFLIFDKLGHCMCGNISIIIVIIIIIITTIVIITKTTIILRIGILWPKSSCGNVTTIAASWLAYLFMNLIISILLFLLLIIINVTIIITILKIRILWPKSRCGNQQDLILPIGRTFIFS